MNTEGKIAYVAVTKQARDLALRLKGLLGGGQVYTTSKLVNDETIEMKESLKVTMKSLLKDYDYIICIMATGIVVRSIAPYVESKFEDPAVLVLDEKGQYVISLLSGHMGGANEMTLKVSKLLKAQPVITTATDVNQKAALDEIIKDLHASVDHMREAIKFVNYGLLHEEPIGLYIDGDYEVDRRGFIDLNELGEERLEEELKRLKAIVYITQSTELAFSHPHLIKLIPQDLVLGMGCKRDTSESHMLESFKTYMANHHLEERAIYKLGSIDIKKDEKAMLALASKLQVPFETLSKEHLLEVEHLFEGSAFVKQNIGVSAVAEPVAYLLGNKTICLPKEKYEGITFALGKKRR